MAFTIRPASNEAFINREEEINDIVATLKNPGVNMGFALYGPRRMGKTSILLKAVSELEKEPKTVVVYFSVWDLVEQDLTSFAKEFTSVVLESSQKHLPLKFKAKELLQLSYSLLRRQISQLKLSVDVADDISLMFALDRERKKDVNTIIDELFHLPERLGKEIGVKTHLFIDEFPDVINLKHQGKKIGQGILKKIRTIYEDYVHTTLNVSGSIKRTMSLAMFSSASPFYRQFIAKKIGPLSKRHIEELFKRNLENRELTNDGLDKIYQLTRGIPYYAQFLGKKFYERSSPIIETQEIDDALLEFLEEEGSLVFKDEMGGLSDKEKRIAIQIAIDDLETSNQIRDSLSKEVSNISQYLINLFDKGILEEEEEEKGKYKFVDPVFKLWLKNRYG